MFATDTATDIIMCTTGACIQDLTGMHTSSHTLRRTGSEDHSFTAQISRYAHPLVPTFSLTGLLQIYRSFSQVSNYYLTFSSIIRAHAPYAVIYRTGYNSNKYIDSTQRENY